MLIIRFYNQDISFFWMDFDIIHYSISTFIQEIKNLSLNFMEMGSSGFSSFDFNVLNMISWSIQLLFIQQYFFTISLFVFSLFTI